MAEAKNVAKGAGSVLAAIAVAITGGMKACSRNARQVGTEAKKIWKQPGATYMTSRLLKQGYDYKKKQERKKAVEDFRKN